MKIRIIGPSGSGKTHLAEALASRLQVSPCEMDAIFWDNSAGGYNKKRDPEFRDRLLAKVLEADTWIVEGVQYAWAEQTFREADLILLLNPSPFLCRVRIIRRFFARKLKKTSRKNETLKSLFALLSWTKKFYRVNLPEIRAMIAPYAQKTVELTAKKECRTILSEIGLSKS